MNFSKYKITLASGSPRRKQMLEELGLSFIVKTKETDETYPADLNTLEVAEYIAIKKAEAFKDTINNDELIITADTVVLTDNTILGKPKDRQEAYNMLKSLSGKAHKVISGVCLKTSENKHSFSSTTEVYFKDLTDDEIYYYIDNYKPFDKAGAYGIQEWIGFIGVERIDGSYFNVVGLPIQRLYTELKKL